MTRSMIWLWDMDSSENDVEMKRLLHRESVYKYNAPRQFKPQICLYTPMNTGYQEDGHCQIRTRKVYIYTMYALPFYDNALLS